MATHSSIVAWRILWKEEPGGLPSQGSHRVRHDWSDLAAAAVYTMGSHGGLSKEFTYNSGDPGLVPGSERSPGGGHGTPLQSSCLENPMDGGAWQAAVHGVIQSQTWLKWLRNSIYFYKYIIFYIFIVTYIYIQTLVYVHVRYAYNYIFGFICMYISLCSYILNFQNMYIICKYLYIGVLVYLNIQISICILIYVYCVYIVYIDC